MQTYNASLVCREPVSPGFSCDTDDVSSFSFEGYPITLESAEVVINEQTDKRCWKCFGKRWRVRSLLPITNNVRSEAQRR